MLFLPNKSLGKTYAKNHCKSVCYKQKIKLSKEINRHFLQKSKEIICLFLQKSKEIIYCFLIKVTKNLCVSKEYFTFVVLKIINMKYIFIVEKTNTGYSAYAENANVATVGDTYTELKENMLEALNMFLEEEQKPLAKENDIEIKFDLAQFLEYYNGINILSLSQKIGVSNSLISQYKTRKKYPSEKQAQKIFQGIKSYGMELASIDLV